MARSRRHAALAKSIQLALFRDPKAFRQTLIGQILAFFSLFYLKLIRYDAETFLIMRKEAWGIDEDEYKSSFRSEDKTLPLQPMGDLGFSGSVRSHTWFRTISRASRS